MTTQVRASKFRHVVGTPMQLRDTFGDIAAGQPNADSLIISANTKYFAMPWAKRGRYALPPSLALPIERPPKPSRESVRDGADCMWALSMTP